MGSRARWHRWKGAASRNDYAVVWARGWFARVWYLGEDRWGEDRWWIEGIGPR